MKLFRYQLALISLVSFGSFGQGLELSRLPARTELHAFPSVTVSDEQFLHGNESGTEVTISGALRIAPGEGRRPVVVMLHGSSGIGAQQQIWSDSFNQAGISTFVLDSFTGRGLVTVSENQKLLGRLNMVLDAYRALEVLSDHPRIDPSRIALLGFSRGGQGTLYSSLNRFHRMWNRSGLEFVAYIPFYPNCATNYRNDSDLVDVPIRIFHGTADDSNPITPCRRFVEAARRADEDVQLIEYENASHGFDLPTLSTTPALMADRQTSGWCTINENPAGELINADTQRPFSYEDSCARAYHLAHDPAAAESATRATIEFLNQVFGL